MKRLLTRLTKSQIPRFLIKATLRVAFIRNLGLVFLLFFLTAFVQPMLATTITSQQGSQVVQANSEQPNILDLLGNNVK